MTNSPPLWLVPLTPEEDHTVACEDRTGSRIWDKETAPPWSGAFRETPAHPTPSNGERYLDFTDNPHGPVERKVGEPDSHWLCTNGHGAFDNPFTTDATIIDLGSLSLETQEIEDEAVDHPAHYNAHPSGIECIDVVEHMGFNLGNAIKYIWRADEKGKSLEDLRKAAWYVNREITKREEKSQ